jgi:hypothetical protein
MLCMLCGAEMRLMKVEQAETMTVAGYEFHTFECSSCQDIERRLRFTHEPTPQPDPASAATGATAAPPSPPCDTLLPAFPLSPISANKDEAAPPISPLSADNIDAALAEAPAIDRDAAAPSASPGSADQDEAAPPVSQQVRKLDLEESPDRVVNRALPRRVHLDWEPEQPPRMTRTERTQWLFIACMAVVVLVLMILHIWR